MDYNSILISALIGGVSIGGAVGIGELLKKAAPDRFHQIITYGAIAVGVTVMTLAYNWHRGYRLQAEVETLIADDELFQLIKIEFPAEYQAAMTKVRTGEEGGKIGAELTSGIRKTYAEDLRASSVDLLRRWNDVEVELIKSILELRGWERCNRYLAEGAPSIQGSHPRFNTSIQDLSLVVLEALVDGQRGSSRRGAATEEDWASFIEYWNAEGATDQDLERVVNFDPNNEKTCASVISYLGAASRFEGAAADQILTELAIIRASS